MQNSQLSGSSSHVNVDFPGESNVFFFGTFTRALSVVLSFPSTKEEEEENEEGKNTVKKCYERIVSIAWCAIYNFHQRPPSLFPPLKADQQQCVVFEAEKLQSTFHYINVFFCSQFSGSFHSYAHEGFGFSWSLSCFFFARTQVESHSSWNIKMRAK